MSLNNLVLNKDILQQYKIMLEDWIPNDASIAIAIKDSFVYFHSGHYDFAIKSGAKVPVDSIAYKVLQTQQKVDAVMDSSLFDTPYYAIGYPIVVNGDIGALVVVLPPLFKIEGPNLYRFLTGKQGEDWVPVPIGDISHIESLQKKTWFYTDGEQFKTTVTLKELQTRLPSTFIRIHRSYIINMYFIKRITRDITSNFLVQLKDGTELPISQSYINHLRTILEF